MANNNNIVRQGFLYEEEEDPNQVIVAKDVDFIFFKTFIKDYLVRSKLEFKPTTKLDYPETTKELTFTKVKKPNPVLLKKNVDKILDTFKKRVNSKCAGIINAQKKYVLNNFKEADLPESYNKLLQHILNLNENMVGSFTKGMILKNDMAKAMLMKEEFGFVEKNALAFGTDIFDKYFSFLFDKGKNEIETELEKGYLVDLYNDYNKLKPTKENLKKLKEEFIVYLTSACNDIKLVFIKHIEKTKTEITLESIDNYINAKKTK